jgi:hypothetical protein
MGPWLSAIPRLASRTGSTFQSILNLCFLCLYLLEESLRYESRRKEYRQRNFSHHDIRWCPGDGKYGHGTCMRYLLNLTLSLWFGVVTCFPICGPLAYCWRS